MLRDLSPEMAGMVSNWCNTLLYGITIPVYFACVYILLKQRGEVKNSTTWILLITASIQFILSTIYATFGLRLLIQGFIQTENTPGGAFLYWINPSTRPQVVSKAVYFTNSLIGDSIMVWRVYIVYGKNIMVALLPATIVVATTITGYISIAKLSVITVASPDSLFTILRWTLATWCLSIATQVSSTLLIVGKLWLHAHRNPSSRSRYMSLIIIIVESGALFSVGTAFLLAFFDMKTRAGAVIGDMVTQIATIVPTLIIIRVGLNRHRDTTLRSNTSDLRGKLTQSSEGTAIALRTLPSGQSIIQKGDSHSLNATLGEKWNNDSIGVVHV